MPQGAGSGSVVVMMVVVVMVMACRKCGRGGKHHQEQNSSENLLHGTHPSRVGLVTEGSKPAGYSNSNGWPGWPIGYRSGCLGISTQEA